VSVAHKKTCAHGCPWMSQKNGTYILPLFFVEFFLFFADSGNCTGVLPDATAGNETEPDDIDQPQDNDDNDNAISSLAAIPGRRSSPRRNRVRINYSLDKDEEEDEERVEVDDDDNDENDDEAVEESESGDAGDDDDEDSTCSESSSRPKKRLERSTTTTNQKKQQHKKTVTASTNNTKKTTPAGAAAATEPVDFECQYCNRKFQGKAGLRYHVDFFVCRPNQRPGGPVRKGKRKMVAATAKSTAADATTGGSSSHSKYKRIRGSLDDRTCDNCSRVFTSVLGLQYHIGECCECTYNSIFSHVSVNLTPCLYIYMFVAYCPNANRKASVSTSQTRCRFGLSHVATRDEI
jgi:hypothetical protein